MKINDNNIWKYIFIFENNYIKKTIIYDKYNNELIKIKLKFKMLLLMYNFFIIKNDYYIQKIIKNIFNINFHKKNLIFGNLINLKN